MIKYIVNPYKYYIMGQYIYLKYKDYYKIEREQLNAVDRFGYYCRMPA
jgi:hypothetical protein